MIKISNKHECSGCHACANKCTINCITMLEDNEGFLYPVVDDTKCINCGLCEKVCPIINSRERKNDTEAYACVNKDDNVRNESSSGGVFTLLAESIINNKGVVFGAGFDNEFKLVHSYTESIEGISKFRGSKYLQSKIDYTYKQAECYLENGVKVLFSGTPCQIAGLLSYLGREYDNLICIDIICHGVPSPKVFRIYRTELEDKHGANTRRIAFRCKDRGWKLFSLWLSYDNGREYRKDFTQDIFLQGFLKNLYLRPSCYNCKFKSLNRLSDITLADFWGIENIAPELDDDKGTSLVIVNSEKGKEIFYELQDKMIYKKVDVEQTIKYNPSAVESVRYNNNREQFFNSLEALSGNITELIQKHTKVILKRRAYKKMRTKLTKVISKLCRIIKE